MSLAIVGGFVALGDVVRGGPYRITGTVDELGAPGSYMVRAYLRKTGEFIRQTWSDEAGDWEIRDLAYIEKGYYIVSFDHGTGPVQAAAADYVTPELAT
jgi:hypothetical protein